MIQFAIGGSIKVVTIDYRQFDISIAGENEILRMIEFDVCEVELRLIYRYFNILEMIELVTIDIAIDKYRYFGEDPIYDWKTWDIEKNYYRRYLL